VRRVERGHEREDAHRKKNRRCERAEKSQAMGNSNHEKCGDDCPRDEGRGFVKIVDGALLEIEAAQEHGIGVQRGRGEEQEIIRAVVLAKTFSPEENRVGRAQTVKRDGEQKEMPVSEPNHADRLNHDTRRASGKTSFRWQKAFASTTRKNNNRKTKANETP
jgi:hypothetical protein